MKKTTILIIAATLILIPVISGCGGNDVSVPEEDTNEEATEDTNEEVVNGDEITNQIDEKYIYPESELRVTNGIKFYYTQDSVAEIAEHYTSVLPDYELVEENDMAYLKPTGGSGPLIMLWVSDDGINIEID